MEYKLTCRNLVFETEFTTMISEIMVRTIVAKLQKPNTPGQTMTLKVPEEVGGGLGVVYRFEHRTETTKPHAFATYWRTTMTPATGTDKLAFRGGYLFLAMTTPDSIDIPPQEVLAEVRTILAEHGIQTVKSDTSELASSTVSNAFFSALRL